jgi:hypothetical protein
MVFFIININNNDLMLGLDFLMKIGVVVDIEKGQSMYKMDQVWKLNCYH